MDHSSHIEGLTLTSQQIPVPKAKRNQLRYSNFLCTINTNVAFQDEQDPRLKEFSLKFSSALDDIFEKNIKDAVMIKQPGDTWDKIKKVQILGKLEIGGEHKKLHAHIGCRIAHYTKIHLDCVKIRESVENSCQLPPNSVYVNSEWMDSKGGDFENEKFIEYCFKSKYKS
jgi:hypothetical protein